MSNVKNHRVAKGTSSKDFLISEEITLNQHGQCVISNNMGDTVNLNILLEMYADLRIKEVQNG